MLYQLSDIFELQMGKTPDRKNLSFWNNGENKWISIADLTKNGKYIIDTKETISNIAVKTSGIKPIPSNTVIMSFKLTIGKTAITKETIYSNEAIMAFIDKKIIDIDVSFLYYLLANKKWDEGSNNAVMGVTLNKTSLSKYKVNIPDIQLQQKIVSRLDKLTDAIETRKKQLAMFDNLIKSRFVEMFGDGIKDDNTYPLLRIKEIGKVVSGATPKTNNEDYWNGNNIWITPAEINDDSFIITDSHRKITESGVKSCALNLLPINTVILSSRAPIGKVAIAGIPMYCNQGFKNIIPNNNIDSTYLYHLLKMNAEYLNSLGRGATFKELSKEIVENIKIKVPPIELQKKFADFVEHVNKSKFVVQKSIDELQTLYDSLMQKYFG